MKTLENNYQERNFSESHFDTWSFRKRWQYVNNPKKKLQLHA